MKVTSQKTVLKREIHLLRTANNLILTSTLDAHIFSSTTSLGLLFTLKTLRTVLSASAAHWNHLQSSKEC